MNTMCKRLFITSGLTSGLLLASLTHAATISGQLQQAMDATGTYDPVPVIVQFNQDRNKQKVLKSLRKAIRKQLKKDSSLSKAQRKQLRRQLRGQVLRVLRNQLGSAKRNIDPLLQFSANGEIKDLWLINSVALNVPAYMVDVLALMPQVDNIRLDLMTSAPGQAYTPPNPPEWNVSSINVPQLWSQGITGQNIVVAVLDTGVDVAHPDLVSRFRGGSSDWYDLHGSTTSPIDGFGHGTNATGLIVGGDSNGFALGMAPGAQWIAARVFDSTGFGTLSDLHAGMQWALDPDGNPATDDAPDVVNNSWGLLNTAGTCDTEFQADIQALKDSGIAVTFAAGNSGPAPGSDLSPANLPGTLSVGAVDSSFDVANSSSRGPSSCDPAEVFPTVTAPGIQVQTTGTTFGTGFPVYEWVGGSSFAVAHVSGVMALLKSAVPDATVAEMEQAIRETAQDLDVPGPDHNTGHGMVDAEAAYVRLLEITQPTGPTNTAPEAVADSYDTDEGELLVVSSTSGVLSNDSDADADPLSALLVSVPTEGQLTLNSDGSFSYQHTGNSGIDSFSYVANDGQADSDPTTVTLNVIPTPVVNTAPVGIKDVVRIKKNSTTLISVLNNDIDAENNIDPGSIIITRKPTKGGRVIVNVDGTVTYQPKEGFTGREVFKYRVYDQGGLRSNVTKVVVRVKN